MTRKVVWSANRPRQFYYAWENVRCISVNRHRLFIEQFSAVGSREYEQPWLQPVSELMINGNARRSRNLHLFSSFHFELSTNRRFQAASQDHFHANHETDTVGEHLKTHDEEAVTRRRWNFSWEKNSKQRKDSFVTIPRERPVLFKTIVLRDAAPRRQNSGGICRINLPAIRIRSSPCKPVTRYILFS